MVRATITAFVKVCGSPGMFIIKSQNSMKDIMLSGSVEVKKFYVALMPLL